MTACSVATTRLLRLVFGTAIASVLGCSNGMTATGVPAIGTALVPPLASSSAQLRFHEGLTANNQPLIDTVLPAVPGPVSGWTLAQWNHSVYLRPASLRPMWSLALGPYYEAVTSDSEATLQIRHETTEPGLVFTLSNSNGTVTSAGGRALYLSAGTIPGVNAGFDHEIDLSMVIRPRPRRPRARCWPWLTPASD